MAVGSQLVKVDLTRFTRVDSIPMDVEGDYPSRALTDDESALYSTFESGRIVKIDLTDFRRVGSVALGVPGDQMSIVSGAVANGNNLKQFL